jgi:SAM-dependent MidA family methyltransferase
LHKVAWANALPESIHGVLLGNEVLDAMPVKLLSRVKAHWHERGVVREGSRLAWQDRISDLRPPLEVQGEHDYLTEIHPQAEAFIASLAERLVRGAAFFVDYGFPEHEYYHPQRHMGTVMCHKAHLADTDPLIDLGSKDITAHVNFTALALAAQNAGLEVLGYTSQARFLLNCGLLDLLQHASAPERIHAQKLIMEHEMGELFKVIGFVRPAATSVSPSEPWQAIGFAAGDRTHTL